MEKILFFALVFHFFAGALGTAEEKAKPFIIAHRGASAYLPEHTLEATAMAHGLGAEYIEQDVVLSKDGVPVVLHDIHLDGVTDVAVRFPKRVRADGKYYAIDFTLAELKELEVKERFKPKTGARVFPGRYSGKGPIFRIATFEEALQLIAGLNASTGRETGIYPEVKSPAWHHVEGRDLSAVILPLLERFGYTEKADNCFLQCFEYDEIRRLREELGYQGRLIMLLGGSNKIGPGNMDFAKLRTPDGLRELAKFVDGIGPSIDGIVTGTSLPMRHITPLVADAHAAGLAVHPYTARADDLPRWAPSYDELLRVLFEEAKVDALFSDFPGLGR